MYVPDPMSSGIDSFSYAADNCAAIMQVRQIASPPLCVCVCVYDCVCVYMCVWLCVCGWLCARMFVYPSMRTYVSICMSVCM